MKPLSRETLGLLLGFFFFAFLLGALFLFFFLFTLFVLALFFLLGFLCATLIVIGPALLVDLGLLLLSLLLLLLVFALLGCEAIVQVCGSFYLLWFHFRDRFWLCRSCGCWRCFGFW